MLRVKDIIISESAPNDPKVGWVTTANGKPTLRFNINGVWKDMIEKPDDPEEDTDTLVEVLQRLWGNSGEGYVRQFTDDYGNIYNVSKVVDSNTISVIKYIPEEQWVTFLFGSNVSFSDNDAIIAAMNGGSTVTIDLADIQSVVSSTRYGNTDNSSVVIYPNQTVWCSAATEVLNVTVNTDGREKSGAMSGVSFLACKPDVTTINFTSGANIVVNPTSPIQFTGSGSKLLQLTFIKSGEGVAYEVYVSVLGENF